MSEKIEVTATPERVWVSPGGVGEVDIAIKNNSNVVDSFPIQVTGLDSSWYRLDIAGGAVVPHGQINGILTIRPPKTSESLAETYPIVVTVSSRNDPSQETDVSVILEVEAYYSFEVDLRPQRASGTRGFYNIEITNTGNVALDIDLVGRDPEDICRFFFEPHQRPNVPPGETVQVTLMLDPGHRPLLGRARTYNFTLTASPERGMAEPITCNGMLECTPRITIRRPRAPSISRAVRGRLITRSRLRPGQDMERVRPSWWRNKWVWIASGCVAVVAVLVIVLVLVLPGGPAVQGRFLLDPGSDVSYGFDLPAAEPYRIRATAEWQGTAESVDLTLVRPDQSNSPTLTVSPDAPTVTFTIDSAAAAQGVSNWVINIRNSSDRGQADGKIRLDFAKVE